MLLLGWNSTTIVGGMDISDIPISIDNLVRLTSSQMMVLRCGMIFFSLPADLTD